MTSPLVVLIAACGQPALLRRTLCSLAVCDKPPMFGGAIVAENGPRAGLEAIVTEFSVEQQFRYLYSAPANKSIALNLALRQAPDALAVFTDDDVQFPRETLLAYARAACGRHSGEFYGGPIIPDYEGEPPLDWLRRFLPRSAAGWKLDVATQTEIHQPEFIGPNMAAFATDILNAGGFDERLGPGQQMVSPGEDTEIQARLLSRGIRGFYVPAASMQHLVRAGNVTPEFAIHRAERNGIYWGINQARQSGFFPRRWLKLQSQWLNDRWRIARWQRSGDQAAQVRASCLEAGWRGRWQGVQLGWNWDRDSRQQAKAAA
jgi:hypothetical protein